MKIALIVVLASLTIMGLPLSFAENVTGVPRVTLRLFIGDCSGTAKSIEQRISQYSQSQNPPPNQITVNWWWAPHGKNGDVCFIEINSGNPSYTFVALSTGDVRGTDNEAQCAGAKAAYEKRPDAIAAVTTPAGESCRVDAVVVEKN